MKEQQGLPANGQEMHHFSNYDLIRRIDVGGMGEVYLAQQRTAFNRKVAVKIIRSDLVHDTIARKRFLREAEVSAHLKHDHILPMFEFGEEQGRLFIVTPYIEGGTLSRRLQSGPLSLDAVHQLFTALVHAVAYIHKRGVIHRDLKPSNILLDQADDTEQVYVRLIDFGIASLQGKAVNPQMTIGGQTLGTIAYLAPERLDGVAAPSNDIYSLGVILYQMLTGELPQNNQLMTLPPALDTIIRRSTAQNPAERYATADDLLRAFEGTYRFLVTKHSPHLPITVPPEQAQTELENQPTPGRLQPVTPPTTTPQPTVTRPRVQAMPPLPIRQPTAEQEAIVVPKVATPPVVQARPVTAPQPAGTRSPAVRRDANTAQKPVETPRQVNRLTNVAQSPFKREDYDAPTSQLDPSQLEELQDGGKQRKLKSEAVIAAEPVPQVKAKARTKRRRRSLLAVIPLMIVIIAVVMGGLGYLIFLASITANVSITPKVQSLSQAFTIKAKLGQKQIDEQGAVIPANVLSSNKSSSGKGPTTGRTDCRIAGLFGCKQTVSSFDITSVAEELKPELQRQIIQDLRNKARTSGATLIGDVVFTDGQISSNPQVGVESKQVAVTVVEQGSIEIVQKSDAQSLARALLQRQVTQKMGQNYTLLNEHIQVGEPVIQSVDANGQVIMAIAAGGIARYTLPSEEVSTIQNHVKGLKIQDARKYLLRLEGIDPSSVGVTVSYGDTLPGIAPQIKVNTLNPNISRLLPITLPKIKS